MYLNLIEVAESFGVSGNRRGRLDSQRRVATHPRSGRLLFDRAQVAEWAVKRGLAAKAVSWHQRRPYSEPACGSGRCCALWHLARRGGGGRAGGFRAHRHRPARSDTAHSPTARTAAPREKAA